ncbi:hypothetical protein [Leucothrix mucor]|uniref:hypothetical protein n=1 Tax=Leucothrix mucor TaxID=45248 RepID=UPI0003B70E2F|nr:hypothetical protein [Leucothrix mucor]
MQAVQALGDRALTQEEQQKLRVYLMKAAGVWPEVRASEESPILTQALIDKTLKDTQYVTAWIARNIRHVVLGTG